MVRAIWGFRSGAVVFVGRHSEGEDARDVYLESVVATKGRRGFERDVIGRVF